MHKIWTAQEEADNLKRLFEKIDNKAAFAREHNIPGGPSMLSQQCKGHRPINMDSALAYARGFGITLKEISPRLAKQADAANRTKLSPPTRGGAHPAIHHDDTFELQIVEWREIVAADPTKPFKAQIPDDALAPSFKKGSWGFFEFGLDPTPGEPALFSNDSGDVFLRRYRYLKPGHFLAVSDDDHAFAPLDSIADKLWVLGVMTGHKWR